MYNQFRLLGQVNPDMQQNVYILLKIDLNKSNKEYNYILHFILELFENLKS